MTVKKLISIVSPCFNEEGNIPTHFERTQKALAPFQEKYAFEYIYTDNCSSDKTFEVLASLAAQHTFVKVLRFSTNIGFNRSITLGLIHAKGDAIILIQSDLQDPPELLPKFIECWEAGNDVAYGKILDRKENFLLKNLRKLFYYLIDFFSEISVPRNAGDFRLTSKRVNEALKKHHEDDPYTRGTIARIGFKQVAIPYIRESRKMGTSSFKPFQLISYAINGFISTTVAPIRFVSFLGFLFSGIGFILTLLIIFLKIFVPEFAPRGFASLACLITFFSGLQLLGIGIIGEYLRKTYIQSLNRPLGFVETSLNLDLET